MDAAVLTALVLVFAGLLFVAVKAAVTSDMDYAFTLYAL